MTRSPFDLSGRVAVVVGGTTGIGRALALGLAAARAGVVGPAPRPAAAGATPAGSAGGGEPIWGEAANRGRRPPRHRPAVGELAPLQALRDACVSAFGH